jgi:hypothetical protein
MKVEGKERETRTITAGPINGRQKKEDKKYEAHVLPTCY